MEKLEEMQKYVEKEITIELDKINSDCGTMELNEKEYVIIPVDTEYFALMKKVVKLVYEKMNEKVF